MLLCFPEFLKQEPDKEHLVHAAVDFMLSLIKPNGNTAQTLAEVRNPVQPESEELVHWCHGAPG